jgi:hypothetical protein
MVNILPVWLQYVQALAVPLIAAVGAWIALQQMQIAHTKLKYDLYERRFAVFEAAHNILKEVIVRGNASEEAIRDFLLGTANAPFLLDSELVSYLQEIGRTVKYRADN